MEEGKQPNQPGWESLLHLLGGIVLHAEQEKNLLALAGQAEAEGGKPSCNQQSEPISQTTHATAARESGRKHAGRGGTKQTSAAQEHLRSGSPNQGWVVGGREREQSNRRQGRKEGSRALWMNGGFSRTSLTTLENGGG